MVTKPKYNLGLHQDINISYPVFFVDDIFNKSNVKLETLCKDKPILVVMDKNISKAYGEKINRYFKSLNPHSYFLDLDATEKNKNMVAVLNLNDYAKKIGLRRDSVFIGIGGGITLDVVGLAAYLYRRGISYLRIPTTLVGMVDAGVGVKVGVNFNNSKNFLGGYHAPLAVFNDQNFLRTIDGKEIKSGLYEMLKMAIIKDQHFFKMIEDNYKKFVDRRFSSVTQKAIKISASLMMDELEGNLYENNLKRKVDFGHTFSPFLETSSRFKIPHGQAVGIDILISTFVAFQRQHVSKEDLRRIVGLIQKIGFSQQYRIPPSGEIFRSLEEIRKQRAGNLNLVLPSGIGACLFANSCKLEEINSAINFLRMSRHTLS